MADDEQRTDGSAIPAPAAARRAARYIAEFTGRHPESVISIERHDGDWQVGVEVVETHRIPDTTDVLAIYEVCLDGDGRLLSYRRRRRYARGQLDKERR
jgi:Gas vesicle synthesis protein GvpO